MTETLELAGKHIVLGLSGGSACHMAAVFSRGLIKAGAPVTRLGRFVAGDGVVVRDGSGAAMTPPQGGWSHF